MPKQQQHIPQGVLDYYKRKMAKLQKAGQKFLPGQKVFIAKDLGPTMSHFPSGCVATVVSTYAQEYGGKNYKSYTLNIPTRGQVSWYYEHQLTLVK